MGLSHSNISSNALKSDRNLVITDKNDLVCPNFELIGNFSTKPSITKFKSAPSQQKLDFCKLHGPIEKAFVRTPSINSPEFRSLENSLFFQLLLDRYQHLLHRKTSLMQMKMSASDRFYQLQPTRPLDVNDIVNRYPNIFTNSSVNLKRPLEYHPMPKFALGNADSSKSASDGNIIQVGQPNQNKLKFFRFDSNKDEAKSKIAVKNARLRLRKALNIVDESDNTTPSIKDSNERLDISRPREIRLDQLAQEQDDSTEDISEQDLSSQTNTVEKRSLKKNTNLGRKKKKFVVAFVTEMTEGGRFGEGVSKHVIKPKSKSGRRQNLDFAIKEDIKTVTAALENCTFKQARTRRPRKNVKDREMQTMSTNPYVLIHRPLLRNTPNKRERAKISPYTNVCQDDISMDNSYPVNFETPASESTNIIADDSIVETPCVLTGERPQEMSTPQFETFSETPMKGTPKPVVFNKANPRSETPVKMERSEALTRINREKTEKSVQTSFKERPTTPISEPIKVSTEKPQSYPNTPAISDTERFRLSLEQVLKAALTKPGAPPNKLNIRENINMSYKGQEKVTIGDVPNKSEETFQPPQSTTSNIEMSQSSNAIDISNGSDSRLSIEDQKNSGNDLPVVYKPSDNKKAYMEYSRTAQQALALLNDEVSAALRDSFCSIDDICFRVRRTMEEMHEADKQYINQQTHQLESQSTPQLEPNGHTDKDPNCSNLLHALSLGLVQTQSENQVRLAILQEKPIDSSLCEDSKMDDELILQMPPLATNVEPEEPIMPKIVPIIQPLDQPCTTLKQQKQDLFNIPPCMPLKNKSTGQVAQTKGNQVRHKTDTDGSKTPITPPSKSCKKIANKELSPEIKLRLKEIAARLGLDDLPRSKAQSNLHNRLIKEFEATDSLIEFQRQMQHALDLKNVQDSKEQIIELKVGLDVNKDTDIRDDLEKTDKKNQVIHIFAEELFVPERKINKIAATNLNSSKNKPPLKLRPNTCQFLYREKKKKRENGSVSKPKKESSGKTSNTIMLPTKKTTKSKTSSVNVEMQKKYSDSLWFSTNRKAKSKDTVRKSASKVVSATNSSTVIKCDSKKLDDIDEKAIQTQTDTKGCWPTLNAQPVSYKTGLDCFDILDEISLRDLKPLESEYPRRDHIGSAPYYTSPENTYLYKLVYGSAKAQFPQLLSVEEPSIHCNAPNCNTCKVTRKSSEKARVPDDCKRKGNETDNKKGDRHKDKKEKEKKEEDKNHKKTDAKEEKNHKKTDAKEKKIDTKRKTKKASQNNFIPLDEPSAQILNHSNSNRSRSLESISSLVAKNQCSGSTHHHKKRPLSANAKQHSNTDSKHSTEINVVKKGRQKSKVKRKKGSEDVASKLLPYIFDPKMRYPTTITVMPVTVTTYTNPNFTSQNKLVTSKGHSGDFLGTDASDTLDKVTVKDKPVKHPKVHTKTAQEKKLWNHKYAKTASCSLKTYLDNQNSNNSHQPMLGDCWDEDFFQNIKNASTSPGKTTKKNTGLLDNSRHPAMQSHILRTHSPPRHPKTTKIIIPNSTPIKSIKNQKKTSTPRSAAHNQVMESHKMLKDIQKRANNTTLENNIQNLIEVIEGKIVDIVSSPEKTHSEMFNTVEKEIVDILTTIRTQQVKLNEEGSDTKADSSSDREKPKTAKDQTKTPKAGKKEIKNAANLQAVKNLKAESSTTSQTTINSKDHDFMSSTEERFEVTASYSPLQTRTIKPDERNDGIDTLEGVERQGDEPTAEKQFEESLKNYIIDQLNDQEIVEKSPESTCCNMDKIDNRPAATFDNRISKPPPSPRTMLRTIEADPVLEKFTNKFRDLEVLKGKNKVEQEVPIKKKVEQKPPVMTEDLETLRRAKVELMTTLTKTEVELTTPTRTEVELGKTITVQVPLGRKIKVKAPERKLQTGIKKEDLKIPAMTAVELDTHIKATAEMQTPVKKEGELNTPIKAKTPVVTDMELKTPIRVEPEVKTPAMPQMKLETPMETELKPEEPTIAKIKQKPPTITEKEFKMPREAEIATKREVKPTIKNTHMQVKIPDKPTSLYISAPAQKYIEKNPDILRTWDNPMRKLQNYQQEEKSKTERVESERQVVLETPSSITTVAEIASDNFLTPFMQALKQFRKEDRDESACNILEFLDTLTNISEDVPTSSTKPVRILRGKKKYCRHTIQLANILHEPEIFYPITVHYPALFSSTGDKRVKVLFESELLAKIPGSKNTVISKLADAKQIFSALTITSIPGARYLNPFRSQIGLEKPLIRNNTQTMWSNAIVSSNKKYKAITARQNTTQQSREVRDDEYGRFLNSVYGMLFVAVFLGLSFNYKCQ